MFCFSGGYQSQTKDESSPICCFSTSIGTVMAHSTVPIRFANANSFPSQDLLTGKEQQAEREGFEPSVSLPTLVFETSTIGHSVTSPEAEYFSIKPGCSPA